MREDSEEVIISRIWDNHGKEVGYEQKGVLVRCKDCKWVGRDKHCPAIEVYMICGDSGYCSYGEIEEQEHE